MAVMEFLTKNILDTTTMVVLDSNTGLAEYLFDRNPAVEYVSTGYGTNTSTVISIEFTETETVSHIILQNHNLKQFRLFYDSVTANAISSFTTNSDTSTYISFSTITCNSVQLQCDLAMTADTEKSIGEFIISDLEFTFSRNPSIELFKPLFNKTQIVHKMPDGGVSVYNIKDKYNAKIGLKFIGSTFYNNLKTIYDSNDTFYYVPEPTSTSWDGKAYEVAWIGKFDFNYAQNSKNNYSGNITIQETVSG